jgi:hypothetical protein
VAESFQSADGVAITRYERDGDIKLGTVGESTEAR